MPVSPMREPTERSMPAVQITADMPRAMIPKKAKLRVILNRLRSVMNTSETKDMATTITAMETRTQNGCVRKADWSPVSSCRCVTLSSISAKDLRPSSVMPPRSPP